MDLRKEALLFVKYNFISGLTTLFGILLLYLFTDYLGMYYLVSVVASYLMAVTLNYFLQRRFNFKDKEHRIARQLGIFVIIALVGLSFNVVIIYALVEYLGIWYLFAKLVAVAITVVWNFLMHRNVTFRGNF